MISTSPEPLVGAEIHGFHTTADLDIERLMGEAATRWFRPNEVHAMLSNYTRFKLQPQPVEFPPSGTVKFFDRKMLRNFRRDGHNWKKKKDGKTVQEAHEKLKIGNEERIHVYYARSEDDPSFYRRCYWLLDKDLERIVLVHYRHTSEENIIQQPPVSVEREEDLAGTFIKLVDSPIAQVDSSTGSAHTDMSSSGVMSEEINSRGDPETYNGSGTSQVEKFNKLKNHELALHEINTLDWSDLVEITPSMDFVTSREGDVSASEQPLHQEVNNFDHNGSLSHSQGMDGCTSAYGQSNDPCGDNGVSGINQTSIRSFPILENQQVPSQLFETANYYYQSSEARLPVDGIEMLGLRKQDSFGPWDSVGSLNDLQLDSPFLNLDSAEDSPSTQELFGITEISPAWGYSTEETKVLVIGHFPESQNQLTGHKLYCMVGVTCVPLEMVQAGVYRFVALPHMPGLVDLYLTFDGHTPISQVFNFDYRSASTALSAGGGIPSEVKNDEVKWKDLQTQIRLAHLLFSTTDNLSIMSNRVKSSNLQEAKKFATATSSLLEKGWSNMIKSMSDNENSFFPDTKELFELILRNKLQEWLLAKVVDGRKKTPLDAQGQGVIHLCVILDYVWAVHLFSLAGMSLDFRDASGWTPLHWAAYLGREKIVAALLSAGANPSLVSDPTPECPGGYLAADLASKEGYDGLAIYLSEKGLTAHFQAMSLSGNISIPAAPRTTNLTSFESSYSKNHSEQDLCLEDSLEAYRNAANAADHIQAAYRERALKLKTRAIQLIEPELEAKAIVAALKIQHAYRSHNRRRMMKAAARIQGHFRTWQARRDFLLMRKHAIKIQAAFRGYQSRKHYRKIVWSVGILEKAVLRWRLKKKGLRGIQVEERETMRVDKEQESVVEEDFFLIGQEQAQERMNRSVVRVQAMFRSYRAQQEYRRMKLAVEEAKLELGDLISSTKYK
ncbi:hypothetical protein J5N97_015348 [Dioscorea zingiberensis]|uniref:CG-1 domain-containing protein n=1 Tax=Dioscorea zingiberensis TaxID=325984 RepID=A0A9D5CVW6_9LILI|nr:hypothetical protein J5N97_015348 [Dioscorea zingiberensis]